MAAQVGASAGHDDRSPPVGRRRDRPAGGRHADRLPMQIQSALMKRFAAALALLLVACRPTSSGGNTESAATPPTATQTTASASEAPASTAAETPKGAEMDTFAMPSHLQT